MIKFIIRRLIITFPQLILLSVLVFILASLMPGDALSGLIDPDIPREQLERMRERLGLNNPWYIQYRDWIWAMVSEGDFGRSIFHQRPVVDLMGDRIWNTIWLSLMTVFFIYAIGLPLGLISGRYNDTITDSIITGYTYLGFATPTFVFALVLLYLFGFVWPIFPTSGSVRAGLPPGSLDFILSKINHLVLPSLSVALIGLVGTVQYLRSGVIETKQKDYVILARAKGVKEGRIYSKHVFRNSIIPIAAFFGYEITGLLGGSVIIEQIFGYPGMGQLFLSSISTRDYSVANILILFYGFLAIVGALLSDIILSIIDPRIRIK